MDILPDESSSTAGASGPAGQVISDETPAAGLDEIATAPGDLPAPEVIARAVSRRRQFRHDNTIVPLAPRPGGAVEVWATSGEELRPRHATVYYTTDGSIPDATSMALPMRVAGVEWDPLAGYLTHWQATVPPLPAGTVVRYRIGGWTTATAAAHAKQAAESTVTDPAAASSAAPDCWAQDGQGFWFRFPAERGITTFAYRVEPPAPALPAWVREAVIYQIFVDRFHPGSTAGAFSPHADPQSRHGGTLHGVLLALPYLTDLGVTCLWLTPVCAAETYHRYDVTDYYTVDPALGSNEDLRNLVADAHRLGMRVLLDFVPSHCSWHHPAFMQACRDRASSTFTWFTFEQWPARYRNFLDAVPSLPSLNTNDPGARAHLIGSAVQWLRDYGVDGFRLDHAIGPSMDFWVALRAATREVAPDSFTVGEATDTPDCLRRYRQRLDAVLDFPLARALRHTFARGEWGVEKLDGFLDAYSRYMADGPGMVSFLDNHDMERFLYLAGGDHARLKLAALCQFTLEATPTIYYGTEIGLSQRQSMEEAGFGGDAEARRDMPWDPGSWDQELLAFYRALIQLRRAQPALRHGQRRTLHLDDRAGAYVYCRYLDGQTPEERKPIVVAFNLGTEPCVIRLPDVGTSTLTSLLSTGAAPVVQVTAGTARVQLAPYSGAALSVGTIRPD